MRKLILSLVVLIFVFAFSTSEIAYAIDAQDFEGDYLAKFSYSSITNLRNELLFEFRLTIDADYLESPDYQNLLQGTSDDWTEPLDRVAQIFASKGYSISGEEGELVAQIGFETYTDYYIAMGLDGYTLDTDDREMTTTKNTLLYKWISYDSTSFFNDITAEKLNAQDLIGVTLSLFNDYGIGIDKVLFEYNYGTPYSYQILDTNAKVKRYDKESKIYYHTLLMDIDNNSTPLTITRRTPNTAVWYGGAAAAGLAVALIPLMIALIKRKKTIDGWDTSSKRY